MDATRLRAIPVLAVALLAAGCSLTRAPETPLPVVWPPASGGIDQPAVAPQRGSGVQLRDLAAQFVGAPYRFGGSTPAGFDCSGLVWRVHELAGIGVPRTALEQYAAAQAVPESALQPGDLVFFGSRRGRVDHVGIYAGDGRFVHAPRTGRPVRYDRLDDVWFATRFVAAGRFWPAPPAAAGPLPLP